MTYNIPLYLIHFLLFSRGPAFKSIAYPLRVKKKRVYFILTDQNSKKTTASSLIV